jgi:hypothetical protein
VVACTPHPGYGTVTIRHAAYEQVVDLATCESRRQDVGGAITVPGAVTSDRRTIRVHGKVVFRARKEDSVEVVGGSPNGKWVLFAVDPLNSASLAADGLALQAVSVRGGKPHAIAPSLLGSGYLDWCGSTLVVTAGGDRIAAHDKWLAVARPPDWTVRRVAVPGWSFGGLACRGSGVVVQAAPNSATEMNPAWQLWQVGLDGAHSTLDVPPPGWADDSPRAARDGKVVFVRSQGDTGTLYGLGVGALVPVGQAFGSFGRRSWTNVSWSLQR